MKKIYITLISIAISTSMSAQLSNLDLETWTDNGSYDDPDGWFTANQGAGILGFAPPVEKITSSPSEGLAAAKMTTVDCASCPSVGAPDPLPGFIQQETAYTAMATSVTFDYKYNGVAGDWGAAVVQLTVWDPVNDSIIIVAQALDTIATNSTSWSSKTMQFAYVNSLTPDSIKINFAGSIGGISADTTLPAPQSGTELSIDALTISSPSAVSVDELSVDGDIYYANDMIHVILTETPNGTISIYDLTGKQVYNSYANNINTIIYTNMYDKGIYLVKIEDKGKTLVKKVVIQ